MMDVYGFTGKMKEEKQQRAGVICKCICMLIPLDLLSMIGPCQCVIPWDL